MSLWIEQKYANILGGSLRNFKVKSHLPYLANMACPICRDLIKNKHKARGYIGEREGKLFFYCHNCNAAMSFSQLLYHQNQSLYKEMAMENFTEDGGRKLSPILEDTPLKFFGSDGDGPLKELQKISQLDWEHPAKKYVISRKIPLEYHAKLRYAPVFYKFVNSLLPDKLTKFNNEGRLIIPFLDENGNCFGFQGRDLNPDSTLRYITIMLSDRMPKVFGLDTVDWYEQIYVLEGPIDSMFIPNSIAMAGSDVVLAVLGNRVFVYDNEKRNYQIVEKMQKIIDKGYKVCIWPESYPYKDVNEAIMVGKKPLDIKSMIDDNTYQGLTAKLKLSEWRKC